MHIFRTNYRSLRITIFTYIHIHETKNVEIIFNGYFLSELLKIMRYELLYYTFLNFDWNNYGPWLERNAVCVYV